MGVDSMYVESELNWIDGRWSNKLVFEKYPNGMGLPNAFTQIILT